MLGPYIKSRGTEGTKMSANADLITVEAYVQGKQLKTSFSYMGQNVKKIKIFGDLRGPGQLSDWGYLALWFNNFLS